MNTLVFTLGEHRSQLTLKISTYPNGNLAIKLYEKDHGILIFWETLTTNLTGIRPDHCAFINIKAADGLFPVWLSDNHLAEPTGQILESDGCLYPEYLFNGKELDALDHEGHTLYIRRQKGELGRRFERLCTQHQHRVFVARRHHRNRFLPSYGEDFHTNTQTIQAF